MNKPLVKWKMAISVLRFDCANTNGSRRFPMVRLVIPKAEHYVSDLPRLKALLLGKQAVSFLKSISRGLRKPHFKFLFRKAKRQGKSECFVTLTHSAKHSWHHLPFCSGYYSQPSALIGWSLSPPRPSLISNASCNPQLQHLLPTH